MWFEVGNKFKCECAAEVAIAVRRARVVDSGQSFESSRAPELSLLNLGKKAEDCWLWKKQFGRARGRWIEMDSDGSWVGWDALVAEFAFRRQVPPFQRRITKIQFSLCFFTTWNLERRFANCDVCVTCTDVDC